MKEASEPGFTTRADPALPLALAVAVRTASYYDAQNVVMREACATLASALAEHWKEGAPVTVGVHSHCVFLGRARVRTTVSTQERFSDLMQLFETWGISTLTFAEGVTEEELLQLVLLLAREQRSGQDDLGGLLRSRGLERIQVDVVVGGGASPEAIAPVEAYAATIKISEEMREVTDSGEPTNVRRLRHVTQAVVDQILRDPGSLLALTTIKDFDRYLISHSTNVAVLSVLIGQRLGLGKSMLGELCLAAFLHDAGKLEVAPEVLRKPGPLDREEWEEMRRHPILAAYALLGSRHLTPSTMRAVVVAFEHHLNYDRTGYPPLLTGLKEEVTLFGNIVAIADRYDALTTARVYRKDNLTPHQSLDYLVANRGTLFDRDLVNLFVQIMGVYPPGTLVELTTGELGVVCAAPAVGTALDRPKVRLVAGEETGAVLDLDERAGDEFVCSVKQVLNPANKGQLPAVDFSVFEPAS